MRAKYKDAHPGQGPVLRHYSEAEVDALVRCWLEAFGGNRHGVNTKAYSVAHLQRRPLSERRR